MRMMTFITATLLISVAVAGAHIPEAQAEPAQFQSDGQNTLLYLDFHNRSWLDVDQVDVYLVFYDALGEVCHRELITLDFERPVRNQGHAEVHIRVPRIPRRAVRVEVEYRY